MNNNWKWVKKGINFTMSRGAGSHDRYLGIIQERNNEETVINHCETSAKKDKIQAKYTEANK